MPPSPPALNAMSGFTPNMAATYHSATLPSASPENHDSQKMFSRRVTGGEVPFFHSSDDLS